jgi:hypothetical protein
LRTALYDRLRESFERSGVPFHQCYCEDRGDGAIVVVPSRIGTAVLVSPLVDRLRAGLRRHNEVSSEIARIRLRVALHTGEVGTDDHGIVGTAVTYVFRILDAPPLKEALVGSDACLAFIASDQVYDDVIRHAVDLIDPDEYRPVDVRVKETTARAWIRVPSAPPPTRQVTPRDVIAPAGVNGVPLPHHHAGTLFDIVDQLLDLPVMAAEKGREQVVGALRKEIATVIPRQAEARMDVYCILRTCLNYQGGLVELLTGLRGFTGDSSAMRSFEESVGHPFPRAD